METGPCNIQTCVMFVIHSSEGVVCNMTGVHFVGVLTAALCISVILLCLWQLIVSSCLLQVCLAFQDG